jgi:hypothetical protein
VVGAHFGTRTHSREKSWRDVSRDLPYLNKGANISRDDRELGLMPLSPFVRRIYP